MEKKKKLYIHEVCLCVCECVCHAAVGLKLNYQSAGRLLPKKINLEECAAELKVAAQVCRLMTQE